MAALLNLRAVVALTICLLGLAAAAFALASPGAGDDGVYEIVLGDGAIEVESPVLAAGRQVIEVTNGGTTEHEVVVVRTDLAPGEIPVGLHGVSPSMAGKLVIGEDHVAAGHAHKRGELLGLMPARSRRYQVQLAPGRYVVLCQTDNHYLGGERTEFDVR